MNIDPNILLQLALVNEQKLVIRAIEIGAGMWDSHKQPTSKELRVSRRNFLPDDPRLPEMVGKDEITMPLPVMACNPLDLRHTFCVQLPNDKLQWISAEQSYV